MNHRRDPHHTGLMRRLHNQIGSRRPEDTSRGSDVSRNEMVDRATNETIRTGAVGYMCNKQEVDPYVIHMY